MVDRTLRYHRRKRRHDAKLLSAHFVRDSTYDNRRPTGTTDWLLIASIDGLGHAGTGDTTLPMSRGHIVCYQPGTPQHYYTDPDEDNWELIWCHVDIRPNWPALLKWPEAAPGLLHLYIADEELFSSILDALHQAIYESTKWTVVNDELACNAFERALLLTQLTNPASNNGVQINERVHRALAFMASNGHRALTVAEIAEHCDCSSSRLSHLFREEVGMAPVRFHEHQRLQRAADLLRETTLTVGSVAAEVGFDDAFYFSNRFRKQFGASPRAFRNQH